MGHINRLKEQCDRKILILDGAMGTEIQKYNLTEEDFRGERFADVPGQMKGNNDVLNLTRPDVISDIYRRYLEAGADIISANTFSSQRISQADYHLEDYAREMAYQGARLARIQADQFSTPDKPRFVAGDVGPTNKTCSMSPDVSNPAARDITYDELFDDCCEQIDGLIALLAVTLFVVVLYRILDRFVPTPYLHVRTLLRQLCGVGLPWFGSSSEIEPLTGTGELQVSVFAEHPLCWESRISPSGNFSGRGLLLGEVERKGFVGRILLGTI